jgi:hypothetical protein
MIERTPATSQTGRRRKLVPVSPDLLAMLFTQGNIIHAECMTGLPDHTSFIGVAYDALRGIFLLCFESAEWEPIPENQELPWLQIMYRFIEAAR